MALSGSGWSALVLSICVAPLAAHAQPSDLRNTSHVGLGYVVNAPNIYVGGGALALSSRGIGIYADVKFTHDPPSREDNFLPGITVRQAEEEFQDEFFTARSSWRSFNLALVRPLTDAFAVYGGAGLTQQTAYREYVDVELERGFGGYYWVEHTEGSQDHVNLLGGVFIQAARNVFFQFGGESAPSGVTVGAMYALPLGRGF